MRLTLRTSNPNKLAEFRRFGLEIMSEEGPDLPEVSGTPEEVITYKALAAGEGVLVEDTSLDVEGFEAGVNIRWVLETLTSRLQKTADQLGPKATWRVMLTYHLDGVMYLSEAVVQGRMVAAARGGGFSFDPHFIPDGYAQTLGELENLGSKDLVSARKVAVQQILKGVCKQLPVASIPPWRGKYQRA